MEEWLYIQTEVYPALLKGFWVSLQLILPSALCGIVIGILVGVLREREHDDVATPRGSPLVHVDVIAHE